VKLEPMDEFESELREAMLRWPAPPSLKRKLMEQRRQRAQHRHARAMWWQRIAASAVLAAAAGGAMVWHNAEQRRKGEEAKQQVLTALRIANHALEEMNVQLAQQRRYKQ